MLLSLKITFRINEIFIGGWSFGGNVAFEMARQLEYDYSLKIDSVFLFDSFNHTHVLDASQLRTEEMIHANIDRFLKEKTIDPSSQYAQDLKNEMIRNALLSRNYFPKIYHGKVVLFKALLDDIQQKDYQFNGWELVAKNLEVEKLSCSHSHLFDPENLSELTKILKKRMENRLTPILTK